MATLVESALRQTPRQRPEIMMLPISRRSEQDYGNLRIPLDMIADYYFPSDNIPVAGIKEKVCQFAELLGNPGVEFSLNCGTLLPMLNAQDSSFHAASSLKYIVPLAHIPKSECIDPRSTAFKTIWQNTTGPQFDLSVQTSDEVRIVRNSIVAQLERANQTHLGRYGLRLREIHPHSDIAKANRRVFEILDGALERSVARLQNHLLLKINNPFDKLYIVVEWNDDQSPTPFLSLELAAGLNGMIPNNTDLSRTLFDFTIRPTQGRSIAYELNSWDKQRAKWTRETSDTAVYLTKDAKQALRQPMTVNVEDIAWLQKHPLKMCLATAKMIHNAVIGEKNLLDTDMGRKTIRKAFDNYPECYCAPAVSDETLKLFREIIEDLAVRDGDTGLNKLQNEIVRLAREGEDVMEDLSTITTLFMDDADRNPMRLWRYMEAFGLNKILPAFRDISPFSKSFFYLGLQLGYEDFVFWDRNFEIHPFRNGNWQAELYYDHALATVANAWTLFHLRQDASQLTNNFKLGLRRIYHRLREAFPAKYNNGEHEYETMCHAFSLLPEVKLENYPISPENDAAYGKYMLLALAEARKAFLEGEDPIGCVIVDEYDQIIAMEHNKIEACDDPREHAEIRAIREAKRKTGGRLKGCKLVTTFETCPMCANEIRKETELSEVIWGLSSSMGSETRFGGILASSELVNEGYGPPPRIIRGVLQDELFKFYFDLVTWRTMYNQYDLRSLMSPASAHMFSLLPSLSLN